MTAELFSRWTPAERWLAGLLWADGHLLNPQSLILVSVDEVVIAAAEDLAGSRCRRYPPQPPRNPAHNALYRLKIVDETGALYRLGFGPKPERLWPCQLASGAFLRGLFDGDGSVCWDFDGRVANGGRNYLKTSLCSPSALLAGMQAWLADQGISPKKINWHGSGKGSGGWQVQWSHQDSVRLAEIMYAEPGPFMLRKHARFYDQGAP